MFYYIKCRNMLYKDNIKRKVFVKRIVQKYSHCVNCLLKSIKLRVMMRTDISDVNMNFCYCLNCFVYIESNIILTLYYM